LFGPADASVSLASMKHKGVFRAIFLRIVAFLAHACVVSQLALAQPWGISNSQKLLTINAGSTLTARISPVGEVYLVTRGAGQTNSISKLDSTGKTLYTTTLAGTYDAGIAFDSATNVYVSGTASTSGFNTTPGAYHSTAPGDHAAYLCKLSPASGGIQYCTYLDTTGDGFVAVDGSGSVAVVFGPISSGPSTSGALSLGTNIHVEKLNPAGTGLVYAANFGGSSIDYPQAAVADATGSLFIAGRTYSSDFPTTPNAAVASSPSGLTNFTSFTVRLNSTGSAFLYSTLGNLGEQGLAIALAPSGAAQVLEQDSGNDLFLRRYKGDGSGILFESSLHLANSPAVGGPPTMAIDSTGVTTVVGVTNSVAFPAYQAVQTCQFTIAGGDPNGVLIRIDGLGDLLQSTWLQGTGPAEFPVLSVRPSTAFELVWSITDPSQGANELDLLTLAPQTTTTPVNLACIGNSATVTGAPLAPGEIVSLFGNGIGPVAPQSAQLGSSEEFPTSISNTEVTFDGVPAPLLYVSSAQINAVTPFGLPPNTTTTQVCVRYEGTMTNCIAAGVSAAAPGVFLNPATPNYAAALNQDGTVNSQQNPLPTGSIVTLFATGLGHVTPSPADGSIVQLPLPTQDLKVQVQVPNPDQHSPQPYFATVLYAGPAPLEIAGLSQINVQIPDFLLGTSGPLAVWVTLPDGTTVKSNPCYIWITE
jgi:uncharacterized protein (TIGR03437 family)